MHAEYLIMDNFFIVTFLIAVTAFVYSFVLTAPGDILGNVYMFAEANLKPWVFKPLIGCCKCVAGQMALWLYPFYYAQHYDLIQHIFFITTTIFFVKIVSILYIWQR